jgi:diketogulonate reductase-like aldo/keto reductase
MAASNATREELERLWQQAHVRPRFVQNRCYAVHGWDPKLREFCSANGVLYQGFSLLTANRPVLAAAELARLVIRHQRTVPEIIFRFAIDIGIIPLTGTTGAEHMRGHLGMSGFHLDAAEASQIEGFAT